MKAADLYDTDFAEWTRQNAELLRAGRASEADLAHIAEEIEDLGKREKRSLHSRCVGVIEHLLKWRYQPERRGSGWSRTLVVQRRTMRRLLDENPSLRPTLPDVLAAAYDDAVAIVAVVTNRPRSAFPENCPFTLEQVLDEAYLP